MTYYFTKTVNCSLEQAIAKVTVVNTKAAMQSVKNKELEKFACEAGRILQEKIAGL
ncbi:MAG TPA: hypothetical protein VF298_03125 [Bacteroidales bacterium]